MQVAEALGYTVQYEGLRYGVEVEVERPQRGVDTPDGWRVTEDGSLRAGFEFVSDVLHPDDLEEAIYNVYNEIARCGGVSSQRTGIHVHVNCQDLDMVNVAAIVAAYCIVEPVLFNICGPEREECSYCVPWYRADTDVHRAVQALVEGNYHRLHDTCKYGALFLYPLSSFGTLEFRMAPTFNSSDELLQWCQIIGSLYTYGSSRTPEQVVADYDSQSSREFTRLVLGDTPMVPLELAEGLIEEAGGVDLAEEFLPARSAAEHDWTT